MCVREGEYVYMYTCLCDTPSACTRLFSACRRTVHSSSQLKQCLVNMRTVSGSSISRQ